MIALYIIAVIVVLAASHLVYTRGIKKARNVPVCAVRGHLWHEGEDTMHELFGGPGFSHGTYIWRCHRCGAETAPGEPPPKDNTWDHEWISPDDAPHAKSCAGAYRYITSNYGTPVPPQEG